jgi:hypothetical protein
MREGEEAQKFAEKLKEEKEQQLRSQASKKRCPCSVSGVFPPLAQVSVFFAVPQREP